MVFGITGGIATGKSTVSQMFRNKGAFLIDADQIARQVVEPGTPGLTSVVEVFGDEVLDLKGCLNRAALGKVIFSDTKKRSILESILHPYIHEKLISDIKEAQAYYNVVMCDIPLLIERQMMSFFDCVILVYAPESLQVKRIIERNGFSENESQQRIRAQMNIEEKRKYADILIDNQESLESTKRQVDQIWLEITKKGPD